MEINPEEKEKAILYLMQKIPEDILKKLWIRIQKVGKRIKIRSYHGFGIKVRETLREGGFNWEESVLNNEWDSLIIEAAKRKNIE